MKKLSHTHKVPFENKGGPRGPQREKQTGPHCSTCTRGPSSMGQSRPGRHTPRAGSPGQAQTSRPAGTRRRAHHSCTHHTGRAPPQEAARPAACGGQWRCGLHPSPWASPPQAPPIPSCQHLLGQVLATLGAQALHDDGVTTSF